MERPLTRHMINRTEPASFHEYAQMGGYGAMQKALVAMAPAEVIRLVKDSGLRGRGGAGFPTGTKWTFVPPISEVPRPRYLVCNADEMEPGSFKDRFLLEGCPHLLVEGVILAAYAVQADVAYIFLRHDYKRAGRLLQLAIAEAYSTGALGKDILGTDFSLDLYLHSSAGRYICGEETALLNALEGRRPVPRNKPPFPPAMGLWGRPTVVNNVETLCNLPAIVMNGIDWYRGLSRSADAGTKIYGVSGKVSRPGVWELPMGTPLRDLIEVHAKGLKGSLRFRAALPGGASTALLVEEHLDVSMDFQSVQAAGSRLGTGTVMVIDDGTCVVGAMRNLIHFFARESCGFCTPCRDGLPWVEKILTALEDGEGSAADLELLEEHCRLLGSGYTFCPLAPGAMDPLASALKYFRKDFELHIQQKRCAWRH